MLFEVITPATDLTLLTPEELRVAAGLASDDVSKDALLTIFEAQIAEEIATDCNVATASNCPPTLRSEAVQDTFRLGTYSTGLILSRRHVSTITSIVESGLTLVATDYVLEAEGGRLTRLFFEREWQWPGGFSWVGTPGAYSKIVVSYVAGFAIVPASLKAEAVVRLQLKLSENSRDPLVRSTSETTDGIDKIDIAYQVGGLSSATKDSDLSPESQRRLKRFMNDDVAV